MKRISEFLTTNPMIVLGMFIFSGISTLVGLFQGWSDFYRDYLSKSVAVPGWVILLVVLVAFFGWVLYGSRAKPSAADQPLQLVQGKTFGVERVVVRGKRFVACKFHGSELMIDGEVPFSFEGCEFTGARFTFEGAAGGALATLSEMFKDPSFRPIVEQIFLGVRAGKLPTAIEPSSGK